MSDPNTQLQTVNVSVSDGVATVQLNRPEALNAWNRRFGEDLLAALHEARRDVPCARSLIEGAGRAFSSGADLKDFSGGETTPDGRPDVYKTLTERYHPIMVAIREMPKPVIASVRGPAVGIGCSLALCCDLIVAARERLLPARVRQHRPRPRRRLLAVRAHPRRHGPRERADDARRAPGSRNRRSSGA